MLETLNNSKTNWISVKDQEPPIGLALLVFTQERDVDFGYNSGNNIFCNEKGNPINVTHWICISPLPDVTVLENSSKNKSR